MLFVTQEVCHNFSFLFYLVTKLFGKLGCDLYLIATHQTIPFMSCLWASESGVRQKLVSFFLSEVTEQAKMLMTVCMRKVFAVTNNFEELLFMP